MRKESTIESSGMDPRGWNSGERREIYVGMERWDRATEKIIEMHHAWLVSRLFFLFYFFLLLHDETLTCVLCSAVEGPSTQRTSPRQVESEQELFIARGSFLERVEDCNRLYNFNNYVCAYVHTTHVGRGMKYQLRFHEVKNSFFFFFLQPTPISLLALPCLNRPTRRRRRRLWLRWGVQSTCWARQVSTSWQVAIIMKPTQQWSRQAECRPAECRSASARLFLNWKQNAVLFFSTSRQNPTHEKRRRRDAAAAAVSVRRGMFEKTTTTTRDDEMKTKGQTRTSHFLIIPENKKKRRAYNCCRDEKTKQKMACNVVSLHTRSLH